MEKLVRYLSNNKRRISRGLYLLAAIVEQLPDPELPKMILGRTVTLSDQLKHGDGALSRRKKRNGKRTARK